MPLAVVGRRCRRAFCGPRRVSRRAWFFGGYDDALAHWTSDAFSCFTQYEPTGSTRCTRRVTGSYRSCAGRVVSRITHFDPPRGRHGHRVQRFRRDRDGLGAGYGDELVRTAALWNRIVQNAMRCDFSWETQANEYLKLFAELLELDAAALIKRDPAQKAAR
jgi:hypothetical protein